MSAAASPTATRRRVPAAARRRRSARRRRLAALVVTALAAIGAVLALGLLHHVSNPLGLPLRHEAIIREQSREKGLDPALVAGVIYAESKFVDQTSSAGARGLMQITPETARGIAQRTGGTAFVEADLATPKVNIAYGAWYLKLLLEHYGGDTVSALAAYNGGQGNVDRWRAAAGGRLEADAIPFAETRAYVRRVLAARADYRREYRSELGL